MSAPSSLWRRPSSQIKRATSPPGSMVDAVRVERHDGIVALQALRLQLDEVNRASARPSPFGTAAFTLAYASNSERDPLGMDVRLFVVRDREATMLGWAVFAFRVDPVVGSVGLDWVANKSPAVGRVAHQLAQLGGAPRLELMTTSDVDRPGIVARLGFEDVVAQSLMNHLVANERDWTLLELRAQEQHSPFWRAAHDMVTPFLRVRDVAIDPYSEVPLIWPDGGAYFRALSKRMRSNVSRQARKLYASGEVAIILAEGAEATSSLFEAYRELETRSWKHQSCAAMGRHPLRVKLYSRIVSGEAGIEPSMIGITLDGVLIAALINGRFENRMWSMEMAFDESLQDLGPGQLLLLLAGIDAIAKGCTSLNFFQLHGYFKKRWLAEELPVVNVQLLRRPSLHDVRGLLGDSARFVRSHAKRRADDGSEAKLPPARESDGLLRESNVGEHKVDERKVDERNGGFNAVKRAAMPSSAVSSSRSSVGESFTGGDGGVLDYPSSQALIAKRQALLAGALASVEGGKTKRVCSSDRTGTLVRAPSVVPDRPDARLRVFNEVDAASLFPFPLR